MRKHSNLLLKVTVLRSTHKNCAGILDSVSVGSIHEVMAHAVRNAQDVPDPASGCRGVFGGVVRVEGHHEMAVDLVAHPVDGAEEGLVVDDLNKGGGSRAE